MFVKDLINIMTFNKTHLLSIIQRTLLLMGGVLFFMIIFSFTTGPFYLYYWLGKSNSEYNFTPKHIIVMGGSGFPSATSLLRSYYTSELYKQYPDCDIYVCQPSADGLAVDKSDAYKISKDLMTRGIDSSKFYLELTGKNTREEALEVAKINPHLKNENCVLVSSPEHMKRAIAVFKKAGFKNVGGEPTFDLCGPADLLYNDKELGGNKNLPSIGQETQLRYQFWNHFVYQIICYRELMAISWYWLKGWI
jgi:uncharacterized SAM-binding protein YcdF (DUF218 family)